MPTVDPAAYSQRALAQAVQALRTQFEGGAYARYVDIGVTATITPSGVGTASLFTVTGGRVCISHIEGRVTTQLQAASRTLKLQYVPDSATGNTDLSAVSADVTGLAVGKKIVPTGTLTTAISIANYEVSLRQATQWILEPGLVKLVSSGADITGTVVWTVNWKPVDAAATLVASA